MNLLCGHYEPEIIIMSIGSEDLSPCVRHCCLNEYDVCLGCFRTLEEILVWHKATDEQKRLILEKVTARKQACN